MGYELTASVHKGMGHIGHNNRTIAVPHSDKSRQCLNVVYTAIPIQKAYEMLFGSSLEEYNKGKKPSRQIKNYYEHIMKLYREGEERLQQAISSGASRKEQAKIRSTYQKPFTEIIVSLGNKRAYDGSFACGGDNEELSVKILNEFMSEYQKKNPHIFVFNAVMHRDEPNGIPHLHISQICWTDKESKRGLKVRLSEHGAYEQQGLGSENEYGTIAFQRETRQLLADIARKNGITIIDGKHNKQHLSKEEYILEQEKQLVNEQAGEILKQQDDLIDYISNSDNATQYLEHLEHKQLQAIKQRSNTALSSAWKEFNSMTSDYFEQYRKQKEMLFAELQRARENANYSRKRLKNLLRDISYGNDFFIVKLFKLAVALFIAIDNAVLEREVKKLQVQNNEIKATAKKVMSESKKVGTALRSEEMESIKTALENYENQLRFSLTAVSDISLHNAKTDYEER